MRLQVVKTIFLIGSAGAIDFPYLFPYTAGIETKRSGAVVHKLSRKAINEGLDQVPMAEILGKAVSKGLTTKQKNFARELAKGSTKAEAYRRSYKANATRATLTVEPYKMAADPRITLEVDAYKLAMEAAKHRTPEALRQLVIKTLVDVAISPDTKDSVKVQAVKVLGTVVEVGAFLERREVINTSSSTQAKAQLLEQLRAMMKGNAIDAIEVDADSLLAELTPEPLETLPADTHPEPTPQTDEAESQVLKHTIPLKRNQKFASDKQTPVQEDPPHEKFE